MAISVPDHYAHGDHVKCGACGTKHKVARGDRLRLVLADVGPVRDALVQNEQLAARLEADLARARGSVGIGANGLGLAVAWVVLQVGWRGEPIGTALLWQAAAVALGSGLLLELANFLFLAKRQRMTTLSRELDEARREGTRLRAILREAARV